MNKQQKEVQQQFLDNEKAALKKLEEIYQDALDEINSKIELLMARQDADMQHVIYQVEYQKALKTQIQSILEQLQANEFETLSDYLTKSYEDGFIGTMYDLQGQGIPLVFPIDQEQVLAAIQHETKLSEGLYAALGKDTKELSKKIAGEISRGIAGGQMYSEIARNIASWARIPKNNAMRIARTEAHRIQCKATVDAQWKAKSKGADVVKQWDSSLDGKTRPTHRDLDGQIRELDEPFEVAGKKAMQPGDFNDPAEDCNCRCALLQRARWALEADVPVTKWAEDAPVLIDDDGTTQFVDMSDAKNYKDFKKQYKQILGELQGNGKVKVHITKIAIDKVQAIELDGYTMQEMEKLQQYHKNLLKIAMDENESNEVAKLFTTSFGKTIAVFGDETGVSISKDIGARAFMLKASESSVVIIHNHPKGTSFSYSDIGTFLQGEVKTLTIVTNKGKVFALNKTDSFDILGISGKIKEIRDSYENPIEHQEEITKRILKVVGNYGVQYVK